VSAPPSPSRPAAALQLVAVRAAGVQRW